MVRRRRWRRPEIDHLSLRILALFLAIVLWFLATDRPQTRLGLEQRTINVETEVVGVGDDLVVTHTPQDVSLTLEGSRLMLSFQAADIRAYVDATGLAAGRHRLPVKVDVPSSLNARFISPAEVDFVLEERATKRVPVRAAVVGVPDGSVVRIVDVEPDEMAVYGVGSAVARTAFVLAQVNPAAPEREARVVPVDEDGVTIAGVATEYDWVDVTFRIERQPSGEEREPGPPDESN